jgi:alginate O-acetyltransferase complex protein AlgI
MPFNSCAFLLFFVAVLFVHSLPLPWRIRKFNLLVASYLFYAAWDVNYVWLLIFSTTVNALCAKFLTRFDERGGIRRLILWVSVVLNLGMLVLFKYGNQILSACQILSEAAGIVTPLPHVTFILPIGLSFFTFQALSYTIDVYRRTIQPATSFLDLALFIAFFPVLLAGPILRAGNFFPQCRESRRASGFEFGWGVSLFTLGLFLKVALADHLLAPIVGQVFARGARPDTLSAWTGTLAFAGQDYCDFAGYSTCAMGVGLCLGFVLPPNFRAPLASIGFRDLWQRWHITLVAWMRDYVFNPLGGVYKGYTRAAINVMITMLLIGLWHGAAWTFLIFGFLHGTYLIIETLLQRTGIRRLRLWTQPIGRLLLWAATICFCLIAFVFYRSETVEQSLSFLATMLAFSLPDSPFRLPASNFLIAGVVLSGLLIAHWLCRDLSLDVATIRAPWWSVSISLALMLLAITLSSGEAQTFLYFQY